ncbi:MAG TPA: hypothetical protein VMU24_12275, partial [Candidatus Acidoferrales bacterium]|nr:hypothetical protein [Candidatus Acidoferrales bacterium]
MKAELRTLRRNTRCHGEEPAQKAECNMSTAAITFDQIERGADRTLGFVLWAKHAKHVALCAMAMGVLNFLLGRLVESLSPEQLEELSEDQAAELIKKLQDVHAQMSELLRHQGLSQLARIPILRTYISQLDEHTADLGDIIEDLLLSNSDDFRFLLSE